MSGFQIRSMGQLSHFQAFRTIRLKDDRGISFQLTVPARLSGEQISGFPLFQDLPIDFGSFCTMGRCPRGSYSHFSSSLPTFIP